MPPGPTDPIRRTPAALTQAQPELERINRELQELGQAQAQAKGRPGRRSIASRSRSSCSRSRSTSCSRMTQLLADQAKKQPATAPDAREAPGAGRDPGGPHPARRPARPGAGAGRATTSLERLDARPHRSAAAVDTPGALLADPEQRIARCRSTASVARSSTPSASRTPPSAHQTLQLHPYLLLNEQWLMSANIDLPEAARSRSAGCRPSGSSTTT